MALDPKTRDRICDHWAERLCCPPAAFERDGATVTEQSGRTVRIIRRGDATIVAAPDRVREALLRQVSEFEKRPLTAAGEIARFALSGQPTEVVDVHGPSVLSYVDATSFSPVTAGACQFDARLLDADDEAAFQRLWEHIPDADWNRASPTFRPGRTAGLFRDTRLVAVASLADGTFPDVGVVVAPDHRDSGAGKQVVSRVLTVAFEQEAGVVPRYRTPESEPASLALAASLGLERWGSEAVVVLE